MIITNRIDTWAKSNNLIHDLQKPTSDSNGCPQHAFAHHKTVSFGFLDLAAAFPTVPREYLWGILEKNSLDINYTNLIRNLYTDTRSNYSCGNLQMPDIYIRLGVKQGCPLSMLLFSLAINPVIDEIDIVVTGDYNIGGIKSSVLGYADDISHCGKP